MFILAPTSDIELGKKYLIITAYKKLRPNQLSLAQGKICFRKLVNPLYYEGVSLYKPHILHRLMKLKHAKLVKTYGPRHERTCLPGFRQSETQSSLLSYND